MLEGFLERGTRYTPFLEVDSLYVCDKHPRKHSELAIPQRIKTGRKTTNVIGTEGKGFFFQIFYFLKKAVKQKTD